MMKRDTLKNLQWVSRKMDFRPTRQQVQQLVDSHLEALDKLDALDDTFDWATVDRSDGPDDGMWKGSIFSAKNEADARAKAHSFGYTVLKRLPGHEWEEA